MNAIYARQSVNKKDSISVESQIEFAKKEMPGEEYHVYTDKGYSGGNINRPDFERLLEDVKKGLIKKVGVYKLDRMSRSLLDFASIIDIFEAHNVKFISATEKFDTSTPIGKAMLNIIMVFAQLERETIQQRIKDNYYERGKKGFFLGGKTPYGYQKEPTTVGGVSTSTLIPSDEEHQYLLEMFHKYAETDLSLGKLSEYLNDQDVPAPAGGKWDSMKISRILRNPVYVKADADVYMYYKEKGCKTSNDITDFDGINGCYLFGKRDRNVGKYNNIEDHVLSVGIHEGCISSSEFLRCQYKLDSNKQIKNSGKGKHSWLSGLIKCGYCKYAMTVTTFEGKHGTYKYFKCRGKYNYKTCDGHSDTIYVEEIEEHVQEQLFIAAAEMKNDNLVDQQENNYEINQLKLQLIDIDNQINNLINQLAQSNDVVMKYINEKIEQLDQKKQSILVEVNKHNASSFDSDKFFEITKNIDKWDELNIKEKKMIAKSFINKVFVKDDEIIIDWKHR